MLTARVTVYDASGHIVGASVATDPRSGDLEVKVANAQSFSTYYVAVQGANGNVFGIGSYALDVRALPPVNSLLSGVNGVLGSATAPISPCWPITTCIPTIRL